jgi:hypothetical protein
MLERLDQDLWTAAAPFRVGGLELGVRVTALRLADGGLFLHSPIHYTEELRAALEPLGPVRFLAAPNKVHHLHLAGWKLAFPEAKLWGPVGLPDKRKDLRFDGVLVDRPEPAWADRIDQLQFYGAPHTNEVVFLHRPTRTLLLTDLAFNIRGPVNRLTRAYLRIGGCHGRLATTLIMRLVVRDKKAARESLERICQWDFDRIVVCHGDVLEHGGPGALREAFAWL